MESIEMNIIQYNIAILKYYYKNNKRIHLKNIENEIRINVKIYTRTYRTFILC